MVASITSIRHPFYLKNSLDWEEWRDTFNGGTYYRDRNLVQFSQRETDSDFQDRKNLTPIPTFAKSAVLDVRNSIYQRLVGVSRIGGSSTYKSAVDGGGGGVDGSGSSMDAFIGNDILTELLVMGRVGCYIDAVPPTGDTLADVTFPPYLTHYRVEDILSYSMAPRGLGGEFQSVLLRDHNVTVENEIISGLRLPNGSQEQFRLVWKDQFGIVWYKLFDSEGNVHVLENSIADGSVPTNLKRVPFVMFDIGDSLLKDVSSYQKALLNLTSNDVYYAIKSNTTFLTIQRDAFASGDHLKGPESADGTNTRSEEIGGGKGRYFGVNELPPKFISPSPEPLKVSMELQDKLEGTIRTLINLAVQGKSGSRTESGESKKISQGGLEAGLSFIGMELAEGETLIAQIWSEYESVSDPDPATIHYPDRYTLKSDQDRLDEAESQLKLVSKLPTQELKRVVSGLIVDTLLGGILPQAELDKIGSKIKSNDYILSDPSTVLAAHKEGLVDDVTASEALGFNADKVVKQARKDRAERIALTLKAQTPKDEQAGATNPASRGAPELDTNPQSGEDEKDDKTDE